MSRELILTAKHVSRISVDVSSVVNGKEYSDGLPEGEALKRIQKENPFYQEDGTLVFYRAGADRASYGRIA